MIKKLVLFATTVVAVGAVAAPAASAFWYHQGEPITADVTEHFVGPTSFASGGGGVSCPEFTANVVLTKGTTIGHIEEFTAVNPATCHVTGGLAFLAGGTNSLTATHFTSGTVDANPASDDISVYNLVYHCTFKSGLEITLTTTGTETLTLTPDNPSAIKHLNVSGDLDLSIGGTVTMSGSLTPTKPGTYGVTP